MSPAARSPKKSARVLGEGGLAGPAFLPEHLPQTWDDLLGNEALKEQLEQTLLEGRASHAYLICGSEGMGKLTLALLLARALRCTGWGTPPCGACPNCTAYAARRFHPDVVFVEPGWNERGERKKTIGVDEIREQVTAALSLRPDGPGKKVFLIPHGEKLTPQAQNALLKGLEEPPDYAVFLLLTENREAILPTVCSRMVALELSPLPEPLLLAELERRTGKSGAEARHIAAAARGSLGRALKLAASEEFAALSAAVRGWLSRLETADAVEAMQMAEEMKPYQGSPEFLDLFLAWYRDVLAALTLPEERWETVLLDGARREEVRRAAAGETIPGVFARIDAVRLAQKRLAANANFVLTMELLLRRLKKQPDAV